MKNKLRSYTSYSAESGFTLIELLIVISIIGILSSFMMVNYISIQQRGRDTQRKSELRQIQAALELYRADNGHYPCTDASDGWWQTSAVNPTSWIIDRCNNNAALSPQYMSRIPKDPMNSIAQGYPWAGSHTYAYLSFANSAWGSCPSGSYYLLVSLLENKGDKDGLAASDFVYCGYDQYTQVFGGGGANAFLVTAP